jgi:hypothetical protein
VAVLQLAPGAWAQSRYKTLHKFSGNDGSMPFAVDPFFKQRFRPQLEQELLDDDLSHDELCELL